MVNKSVYKVSEITNFKLRNTYGIRIHEVECDLCRNSTEYHTKVTHRYISTLSSRFHLEQVSHTSSCSSISLSWLESNQSIITNMLQDEQADLASVTFSTPHQRFVKIHKDRMEMLSRPPIGWLNNMCG